jgi:hypothetical protein
MHFTALGSNFPTVGLLSFTKYTHSSTFGGGMLLFFSCNISIGICHSNTLKNIRLINCVAVMITRTHKYFKTFMEIIIHRATSNRCLFFLSATPFCAGVRKDTWSDDVSHKLINTLRMSCLYIQSHYRILVPSPLQLIESELSYENA